MAALGIIAENVVQELGAVVRQAVGFGLEHESADSLGVEITQSEDGVGLRITARVLQRIGSGAGQDECAGSWQRVRDEPEELASLGLVTEQPPFARGGVELRQVQHSHAGAIQRPHDRKRGQLSMIDGGLITFDPTQDGEGCCTGGICLSIHLVQRLESGDQCMSFVGIERRTFYLGRKPLPRQADRRSLRTCKLPQDEPLRGSRG